MADPQGFKPLSLDSPDFYSSLGSLLSPRQIAPSSEAGAEQFFDPLGLRGNSKYTTDSGTPNAEAIGRLATQSKDQGGFGYSPQDILKYFPQGSYLSPDGKQIFVAPAPTGGDFFGDNAVGLLAGGASLTIPGFGLSGILSSLGSSAADLGELGINTDLPMGTPGAVSGSATGVGGFGGTVASSGVLPYNDPIEGLIDLTNKGLTGEQAVQTLGEINPAWTQTAAEFLKNNPSGAPTSQGGSSETPAAPGPASNVLSPEITNLVTQAGLTTAENAPALEGGVGPTFDTPAIGSPIASTLSGGFGGLTADQLQSSLVDAANLDSSGMSDQVKNFLKNNWKTLLTAAPAAASVLMPKPKLPNVGDINSIAANLTSAGGANMTGARALMNPLEIGTLPAPQQASLDQSTNAVKAQIRDKYARLGLSGSTMEQQDLQNVDLQGQVLKGQMEQQLFTAGLSEAGVSGSEQVNAANLYRELAQMTLSQDEELRAALGNLAKSLALGSAFDKVTAKP